MSKISIQMKLRAFRKHPTSEFGKGIKLIKITLDKKCINVGVSA